MTSTQSKSSTKSSKPSGPRPSGSSTSRSSVPSSTPTPTRSSALSKEGERLFGRAFSAKELTQFELVRELKPDWTTQKVLEFCKKYEFDETNISRELSAEFEFERASHEAISEEWQDVPKREPKKKETTPTAAPTGKFTPATDRPKTAGGKPDGKPFVNGGKKYQPSAASDRAYALMKQQQEKERLEKEKKKEVPLPVPGKSFLAALVKPPAPTPTPSPPPAQAQTAAKTNGSTTATPATGAPSTATPAAATAATATTTAAAPTSAPKSEEKKEESKSGKGSKTGDAKSPSSPSAAPTKTWQKKDKSAAQAAAAATTTPAATSTTTPATNAATTTATTTPATTTTNATTPATTTPATSTPAAAASSTTSATPAATSSTTAVTPAAAPSTTEAAATPAPAAAPAAAAPVTPAPAAAAPAAAAKPTPAAAPSTAVNPRVNDLLSSEQKVLLPSHIASAASGTFQFTSKASGPRAPKPKDAAPVAAPAAAAAAPAPVAAAPAAAQPTVQQTAPVQQLQAAIGGNSRPFGGLSSSTGPAPIGSKPIGSHLDSTPSGQPTGTDNEIIPGGHASAHHFGSTLHDDAHLGSSTGAEASAYDNSQFGNQLQNFHQDVLAGANQGVASNYDAEYQQSVNYSGATGQNDEFYGSYDYNQFGRKPQGQRPPQGQQRGQAQGQQNFQQRVNTGLPKSSQPMSQQQGGLGPNAGQRPGVNAVNNTNKPPQQQMQQQQQNRPVGAQATGFPSQQGQAPGQFNQQPKPQQQPQQQYQQYQQNFPNKPIGGQPNSPQFNQGNKNVAPGQQQQQQQGGYNKQFNNKPNQNNPQAYTAYSQYPAGYGYGQQYGMPGGYNSYYQPGYGYPYGQPAAPFAQPNRFPAYQQSFGGYPGQISPTFDNSGYGASDDHSKYMYANQPAAVQSNVGTDGQPLLAQAPQAGGYEGWGQDAISGSKAGVKQDAPSGDLNARGAAVGVPNYSAGFSASPALTGAPVQQGPYSFQQPQQSHIINHQPFPQPQDQQRYQQSFQQWSQQ